MGFWDALVILRRRWYLVIPALFATAGMAFGLIRFLPDTYQASAQLLLLSPAVAADSNQPINPYLGFSSALAISGDAVARVMMSDDTATRLYRQGATSAYLVGLRSDAAGPVLIVQAQDKDPASALRTKEILVKAVQEELATLQTEAKAPAKSFLQVKVLASDSIAKRLLKAKTRALVAVVVLGLIASLAIAFAAESLKQHRRRRAGPGGSHRDDAPAASIIGRPALQGQPESVQPQGSSPVV